MRQAPLSVPNSHNFYEFVDLMRTFDPTVFGELLVKLDADLSTVDASVRDLAMANEAIIKESARMTRHRDNPFSLEDDTSDPLNRLRHSADIGGNFIHVIFEIVASVLDAYHEIQKVGRNICPQPIILMGDRITGVPKTLEEIQILSYQVNMNQDALSSFAAGILMAERTPEMVAKLGSHVVNVLDAYYSKLLTRHSTEGIEIHKDDPIATDVAISVFENTDANGEIQEGKDPKEISAYSVRKAYLIANTVQTGLVGKFMKDPDLLINFITDILTELWDTANQLSGKVGETADKVRQVMGRSWDKPRLMQEHKFFEAVRSIKDLNPRNIVYKEKLGLMTAEERKELQFRNDTLRTVVAMLSSTVDVSAEEMVNYILGRKYDLRTYHMEENSFYVCKISGGNPFGGEAPGALSVVPGSKPTVTLADVRGSGFDEVRDFIANVKHGAKWHDLFVATSPSKRADKSNVLLVGPQGCGKTEVLRAVASDRSSIGIFAQSSDFLTCWKGEAEKNPKRLFEEGIRLQRESKKQVFFLIDEIDTILNSDQGHNAFGGTNLATEFQVLMDGITTYPNLALWGATNHPERIPMPLIRRFAKVVIVGELDQKDRVDLLKKFVTYLPVSPDFADDAWEAAAMRLEGAVGDVVRKIADHLWREKMSRFVETNSRHAERLVQMLNPQGQKFNVGTFSDAQRAELIREMAKFDDLLVHPKDVMGSIDAHLSNVAIQAVIQTCRDTYSRARSFLSGINAR